MHIRKTWDEQPLTIIMALAILFRLLAAIFAKGWGMFDDHYIVIESAQSWVDGHDYNNWLPWSAGNAGPTAHNLFYPGINFLFFSLMKLLHIHDPQLKMFFRSPVCGAFRCHWGRAGCFALRRLICFRIAECFSGSWTLRRERCAKRRSTL